MSDADDRVAVLEKYKKVVRDHREMETRLKNNRESVKDLGKEYQQTEDALKALQVRRPRPISAPTCSRARRLASLQLLLLSESWLLLLTPSSHPAPLSCRAWVRLSGTH